MARKKKIESESAPKAEGKHKELLTRIRDRYDVMVEADQENRRDAMEDLRFLTVPGEQWDPNMKAERGNRPCYEFNKLRISAKRIINNMRANRVQGKVRGTEDGDVEVAEINEGLIRNIWANSNGDAVIDYAAEYQVGAGYAAWRVSTKYSGDNAFEQDIVVESVENPFCLYCDPAAKDVMGRDADDWLLTERISKKEYEERWPKAEAVDFEDQPEFDSEEWSDDETVRICEYWWREPEQAELWQLRDGRVIDAADPGASQIPPEEIERKRQVQRYKIQSCIASGNAILEGPTPWAGRQHPFVRVYGEYVVVDGKRQWFGIARFAKDPQRSYNVSRTAVTETIALSPQAKFWSTPEQAKGHTEKWDEAHRKNFPFLLFNPDPMQPGPPQRMPGPDIPMALIQEMSLASDEIKAITGIYDSSLGAAGNETSGRAIQARANQGEIATFNYQDNMAQGIRRTWEILLDLIPSVFDTERNLRVLGTDGADKYVRVNQVTQDPATGEMVTLRDLSQGKYDIAITVGPSWSTRRQEAADTYLQMIQANPEVFGVAGDLVFKSLDLPYAEDIAERLRVMLPPPIQQMMSQNEGKPLPPEVQAAMAQVQQMSAQMQEQMQVMQQASGELEQQKSDTQVAIANLKTEEARFEAKVAQANAKITERATKVMVNESKADVRDQTLNGTHQQVTQDIVSSLGAILQPILADFGAQVAGALIQVQQQLAQPPALPPRVVRMEGHREGGKIVATPIYEDRMN